MVAARVVGDSLFITKYFHGLSYRTLRALYSSYRSATWGSAPLHPRLYAIAALRGLKKSAGDEIDSSFLKLIGHFLLNLLTRFTNDFQSCIDIRPRGAEVGDACA